VSHCGTQETWQERSHVPDWPSDRSPRALIHVTSLYVLHTVHGVTMGAFFTKLGTRFPHSHRVSLSNRREWQTKQEQGSKSSEHHTPNLGHFILSWFQLFLGGSDHQGPRCRIQIMDYRSSAVLGMIRIYCSGEFQPSVQSSAALDMPLLSPRGCRSKLEQERPCIRQAVHP